MGGWMIDEQMIDGWMDGWMDDRWVHEWLMDGWMMDREVDTCVNRKIEYIKKEMWVSGWIGDGKIHGAFREDCRRFL